MIVPTKRMQYFSDGVIAIAMTIMVLDIELTEVLKISPEGEWESLIHLLPRFLTYLLSFAVLGTLWINHHTLYHLILYVDVRLLWLNLHLLFWLTLIPFSTSLLGRYPSLPVPIATFSFIMLMLSVAFTLSQGYALRHNMIGKTKIEEKDKTIRKVLQRIRLNISIGIVLYLVAVPLAFASIYVAYTCIIISTVTHFIPGKVVHKNLGKTTYFQMNKPGN